MLARSILWALPVFALAGAFPAQPQDHANEATIITNVWATPDECATETAKNVAFSKLASDPGSYAGQCLRVEGLWLGGRAFYSDVRGFYTVGPKLADVTKSKRAHRIGLYAKDGVLENGNGYSSAYVIATGIAGTCRGLHRGHTVTVMGYCHYTSGPILKVSSFEVEPRPYTRFTGKDKRETFGNLDLATEDWLHRAPVEARMEEWRGSIRRRDRKDFAAINGIDLDAITRSERQIMKAALADAGTPFADFHRSLDARPLALLVEKNPWRDDKSDPRDYVVTACYCRTNDCGGRWPISDFDAPSANTRPYICARLWQYFESEQAHVGLDTLIGPDGFMEQTKK